MSFQELGGKDAHIFGEHDGTPDFYLARAVQELSKKGLIGNQEFHAPVETDGHENTHTGIL